MEFSKFSGEILVLFTVLFTKLQTLKTPENITIVILFYYLNFVPSNSAKCQFSTFNIIIPSRSKLNQLGKLIII
jgi:hypothetical protein